MTPICVSELTIIGSDNDLSPGRGQVIWTNAGISLTGAIQGIHFGEIVIEIRAFVIKKNGFQNVVRKMAVILSRPQCVNDILLFLTQRVLRSYCTVPLLWNMMTSQTWWSRTSLTTMKKRTSMTLSATTVSTAWRRRRTRNGGGNKRRIIIVRKTLYHMMTSSNGNIFRVTGHLCGEFTGPRWIPRIKASDAELWCFLWSASE